MIIKEYLNVLLSLLFLITSTDKLLHKEQHIEHMKAYRLVNESWIPWLFIVFLVSEAFFSFSVLFQGIHLFNAALGLLLLSTYTLAISINLLRGRTHISCGCGAFLESDRLGGSLILRNVLLMLLLGILYQLGSNGILSLTVLEIASTVLLSVGTLLLISLTRETIKIIQALQRIKNFLF